MKLTIDLIPQELSLPHPGHTCVGGGATPFSGGSHVNDEELAVLADAFTIEMLHDRRPLPYDAAAIDRSTRAFLKHMRTCGYEEVQGEDDSVTYLAASGRVPWRAPRADTDPAECAIPCSEDCGTQGCGDSC